MVIAALRVQKTIRETIRVYVHVYTSDERYIIRDNIARSYKITTRWLHVGRRSKDYVWEKKEKMKESKKEGKHQADGPLRVGERSFYSKRSLSGNRYDVIGKNWPN